MKIEAENPRQGTPSEGGRADAAAAKSIQSCPILCDPIDGSPPGSPVPGILQARTLKWVAISFSNAWKWKVKSEVTQLCPTLCDPMDCSPPGSSVHGIFQARVLEWVAIVFSDTTQSWVIYYGIPKKLIMPTNLTPISIQTSPPPQTSYKSKGGHLPFMFPGRLRIPQQGLVLKGIHLKSHTLIWIPAPPCTVWPCYLSVPQCPHLEDESRITELLREAACESNEIMLLEQFLYTKKGHGKLFIYLLSLAAFLGTKLSSEYFLSWFLQPFFLYGIMSASTETFSTLFFPKNKQQQYFSLTIPLLPIPTESLNSSLQQIFSFSALTAPTSLSLTCVWTHWNWLCPFTGPALDKATYVSLNPKEKHQLLSAILATAAHLFFFFF